MLVWCAALGIALAEEPVETPEPEPEPLLMPTEGRVALPDPAALPTALDDRSRIEDPDGDALLSAGESLLSVLDAWSEGRREVWSGRNVLRPLLAMRVHDSGRPTVLGATVGRQWWQLRDGPRAVFEALLTGETALASGAGSWTADLTVLGGVAVGPASLSVGPSLIGDRTVLGSEVLDVVAALAPVAQVTLDLRRVQLFGAAAPRFFVAGDRAPASGVPLGDEPVLRAGLGVTLKSVRLNADWTGRWTAADRIDRIGVGARIRL